VNRIGFICATAKHASAVPALPSILALLFGKSEYGSTGERKVYERDADSGYRIRFHFCPNCGTTVYWEGDRNPAVCGVAVGVFDRAAFPPPSDSIWEESMYSWLGLPPRLEHHQQGRPPAT
jgi:hypothetical protein